MNLLIKVHAEYVSISVMHKHMHTRLAVVLHTHTHTHTHIHIQCTHLLFMHLHTLSCGEEVNAILIHYSPN